MLSCGNLFERQAHDQRQQDRRHSPPDQRSFAIDNQTFESNSMHQFPGLVNDGQYFGNILSEFGDCRTDDVTEFAGHTICTAPPKLAMCSPLEMDSYFSLNSNCTKAKAEAEALAEETENTASMIGGRNSRKRKAEFDKTENSIDNVGLEGEESEVQTRSNRETSTDNSKDHSMEHTDYIHVRARRGQATDSHSLAERARREKINKKMKLLQELVPGCSKVTGKAGMLDEIINYVQSLQRQVEFLSMKLASSNPRLDFNLNTSFLLREYAMKFPAAYTTSFPAAAAAPSEMGNLACFQFNQVQQRTFGHELMNATHELTSTQSSSSLSKAKVYLDSSCLPPQQAQPLSTWETRDFHTLPNSEYFL